MLRKFITTKYTKSQTLNILSRAFNSNGGGNNNNNPFTDLGLGTHTSQEIDSLKESLVNIGGQEPGKTGQTYEEYVKDKENLEKEKLRL